MSIEMTEPFSLEELNILEQARFNANVEYLMRWSKAAVKYYEAEKNLLKKQLEASRDKVALLLEGFADIEKLLE